MNKVHRTDKHKTPEKSTTPKKNSQNSSKKDIRFSSQSKKSSNSPESSTSSQIPEKVIFPWSKVSKKFKYRRTYGIPEQLKNIITHEEILSVLKDLKRHPLYHIRDEYSIFYGLVCLLILLFFIISVMSYTVYGAISVPGTSSSGLTVFISLFVILANIAGFIILAYWVKVKKERKLKERETEFQKILDVYNKDEKWVESRGMRWSCGVEGAWIELEISKETREDAALKSMRGVKIKSSDIWVNKAFKPTFEKPEEDEEFGLSELKREAEKKSGSGSGGKNSGDHKEKRRSRFSSGYEKDNAEEEQNLNVSLSSENKGSSGEIDELEKRKRKNLKARMKEEEVKDEERGGGNKEKQFLFKKRQVEGGEGFGEKFSKLDKLFQERLGEKKKGKKNSD